jgi:hypothetical protein
MSRAAIAGSARKNSTKRVVKPTVGSARPGAYDRASQTPNTSGVAAPAATSISWRRSASATAASPASSTNR